MPVLDSTCPHNTDEPLRPAAYGVPKAAQMLDISQGLIWKLIREDRLQPVRIGGRTLIPLSEINRLTTPEAA